MGAHLLANIGFHEDPRLRRNRIAEGSRHSARRLCTPVLLLLPNGEVEHRLYPRYEYATRVHRARKHKRVKPHLQLRALRTSSHNMQIYLFLFKSFPDILHITVSHYNSQLLLSVTIITYVKNYIPIRILSILIKINELYN